MNSVIYDPLEEYEKKYRALHAEKTAAFLESLVERSGVDAEANRITVEKYHRCRDDQTVLRKKLNLQRFFRVLMCISLVLIPVVILKTTPKIRALREELGRCEETGQALLAEANRQLLPLLRLFDARDAVMLTESALPLLSFSASLSPEQEQDMVLNYDDSGDREQTSLDLLAGRYHENPFLFEQKRIHTMGTETYHGYKTIRWTETYRDSNGKLRTRTRTQTLHATVTKPKPFYRTQTELVYGSQGGANLSFSRDASHLQTKSERELERYVRRGERRLKRKTDKAIRENDDFVSMSNTDFEVLFDALDRTDEVQFRALFTPLAQTNMVSLLLSKTGYGDDFDFIKRKRLNRIISVHSQNRSLTLPPEAYASYCLDTVRENFMEKNREYFRAVYFDFAPLLAIPTYQERPVHSLKPLPDTPQTVSLRESEALANAMAPRHVVHPRTQTKAILKAAFAGPGNGGDEIRITAFSYDIKKRVDVVSVWGGDGRCHSVPVEWDEYLPLEAGSNFLVCSAAQAKERTKLAERNGLCICTL